MAGASGYFQSQWGIDVVLLSAGSLVILTPTLIVFVVFQRQFVAALLQIRPALDLCAYLEVEDAIRIRRLVDRHVRYGKPRLEAERFARNSDERNARLIKATRDRADFIVREDPLPRFDPRPPDPA